MPSAPVRPSLRVRGAVVTTLAAAHLALSLAGCSGYHPDQYAGDGTMIVMAPGMGTGVNRYELELTPIDLNRTASHEFQLSGLPSDNLTALLCLDEPGATSFRDLDARGVHVTMTLRELNRGYASAKAGALASEWGTTPESWNGQPIEFQGVHFRARRHDFYVLNIDVRVDRPGQPGERIMATPRVRGGVPGTF
jgi:hypothetical protein